MKRLGCLWDEALTDSNCIRAVIEGTQYKRKNRNVRKFLYDDAQITEKPGLWHMVYPEKALEFAKKAVDMDWNTQGRSSRNCRMGPGGIRSRNTGRHFARIRQKTAGNGESCIYLHWKTTW